MKYAIAAFLIIGALAGCAKGAQSSAAASASAAAANNPASASDGGAVYVANCSSCHQTNGQGVPGAFPPLAGNPVVAGNPIAVIAIVKNGIDGRVEVNGQAYSGIMPRWKGVLSDEQIASVITYIRSSWKNHAPGVSVAQVQSVK
ncbi:MAG: cytochrome c [Candidatus Eremiobacteraeota bacterium]|nr:cytochrome c [Candidatus Eremiobacteraeota bacterium]